jgi:CPA2 family monovalent cation:H+ antiporter-2
MGAREGCDEAAFDLDPSRVREAHRAREPVYYGDASERAVLESVGIGSARHGELAL